MGAHPVIPQHSTRGHCLQTDPVLGGWGTWSSMNGMGPQNEGAKCCLSKLPSTLLFWPLHPDLFRTQNLELRGTRAPTGFVPVSPTRPLPLVCSPVLREISQLLGET